MLLNQDSVFVLDTTFLTILPIALRNKYISTHAEFLAFFFGSSLNNQINKLKACETDLLPVFNTKLTKKRNRQKINEGNLWGLAVLDKNSATLRLYDSSHVSHSFEHIIPDLLLLVNTIRSLYEMTQTDWPMQWTYCRDVYSVQQDNGYDCGIFVMMNAFYVSQGIAKPVLIPGDHFSDTYRPNLGLCLPESDTSFVR